MPTTHDAWYNDSPDTYAGCAMPVGEKAVFWRQYLEQSLHARVQSRSLIDAILLDFAHVEEQYRDLDRDFINLRNFYTRCWPLVPWWRRLNRLLRRSLKS